MRACLAGGGVSCLVNNREKTNTWTRLLDWKMDAWTASTATKLIPILIREIEDLKGPRSQRREHLGKLTYFNLLAKGLQPVLCAEFSGLDYDAESLTVADWSDGLKAKTPAPFGQLPMLECEGTVIAQAAAVCSYIGLVSNTGGINPKEYAVSQMLLAEGDEIFAEMLKNTSNIFHASEKTAEEIETFWKVTIVGHHVSKLEAILSGQTKFTSSGVTVGELYLWGMLRQALIVRPTVLNGAPCLMQWHSDIEENSITKRVIEGKSKLGAMGQFFVK